MDTEIEKYNKALQKAIQKISTLNDQLNKEKKESDVAVIGYNCRFPGGANSAEEFWNKLVQGYDAVTEVKPERFSIDSYYDDKRGTKGKTYTKQGAFLDVDIRQFDPLHFEISATEAVSIDPQHRLLLEVSWEALENAGLDIQSLRGSNTGVFIGMDGLEYAKAEFLSDDPNDITPYSLFGISQHSAAGRLAYFYDWKGPAFACNTACSSSLVALNAAVESLKKGECDMAVVGGINLILTASSFVALSQIQALSPDGRCKAFDASADGYGRGEGCGIVILKRAIDAERDGNAIQAVIKSSYVGQDGKANGFFAPNGISEQRVLKQGLLESGFTVDDIDYMEAHGTGTSTGDFIETSSICEVYKQRKEKILIGSVKSNIGHLEAASGIAGLIKVLLSMKYHKLPPSIHFQNPNPSVNWDKIQVVDKLMEWSGHGKKLVATVSSFGISGTLSHVILEEPEPRNIEPTNMSYRLLTFSAKTEKALKAYLEKMVTWLQETEHDFSDIAYTTNQSKSYLSVRAAFIGIDKKDIIKQIEHALETDENWKSCFATADTKKKKKKEVPSLTEFIKEKHESQDWLKFWEQVKMLYKEGVWINWKEFYQGNEQELLMLPNYCFQRKVIWKEIHERKAEKMYIEVEKEEKKEGNKIMADRRKEVSEKLKDIIQQITGMDTEEINESSDLFSFGFDSLMLMNLGEQINHEYNMNIPAEEFFTNLNNLESVTECILNNLRAKKEETEDVKEKKQQQQTETVYAQSFQEETSNKEFAKASFTEVSQPVNINTAYQNSVAQSSMVQGNINFQQFQSVFENQCKILSEQNELIRNLTTSIATKGMNCVQQPMTSQAKVIEAGSIEKTYTRNEIDEEREKKDYFIPYHKVDVDKGNGLTDLQYEYVKKVEKEFNRLTKGSKESTQHFRVNHASARNTAGFTRMLKEMTYQIVAEEGKGSKIKDVDGNEFLDVAMGFGVNLFGHAPKFITDALKEEIEKGFPLGPMGRLAGTVAKQICKLTGNERVFFCNSGTEADMFALRIARAITGKDKIVIFAGAYHGTYDGILGIPILQKDGSTCTVSMVPGVTNNAVKDLVVLNYNTPASLQYIEEHADEIAGILVETVQSRRPDVQPKKYLKKLRKLTEEKDIALIFDEVITGFRIGAGGAQEFYGINADIVTYGKIVGGGMPIGIVAGKAKFMDSVDGGMWCYGDNSVPPCSEKRTMVAGTFCHHGLAMAAANVVLKYIEENKDTLYPELNGKTKKFVDRTNAFFKEENVPFTVVNFGSLFRFYNVLLEYDIFYYSLIAKGIYIWEGRNCFFSTEHSQEDIDKLFETIKETIYEMKEYGYFTEKKNG